MKPTEEQMENYMNAREESAWNRIKEQMYLDKVPKAYQDIIKRAFLIGYSLGSIDEEKVIKHVSKQDPIQFYEWLKE